MGRGSSELAELAVFITSGHKDGEDLREALCEGGSVRVDFAFCMI